MERCSWGEDLERVEEGYVLASQRERDRGGEKGPVGRTVSLILFRGCMQIYKRPNHLNAIITFEDRE